MDLQVNCMWDQFPGVVQCREDEQIGEDPRLIQDEGMLGVQPRLSKTSDVAVDEIWNCRD